MYTRLRGDMIELFKLIHNKYKILQLCQFWNLITEDLPEETNINHLIRTFAMI